MRTALRGIGSAGNGEAMRSTIGIVIVVWLVIGLAAAFQRGYVTDKGSVSCHTFSDTALTIIAGPLNYVGVNPKVHCKVPTPSKSAPRRLFGMSAQACEDVHHGVPAALIPVGASVSHPKERLDGHALGPYPTAAESHPDRRCESRRRLVGVRVLGSGACVPGQAPRAPPGNTPRGFSENVRRDGFTADPTGGIGAAWQSW